MGSSWALNASRAVGCLALAFWASVWVLVRVGSVSEEAVVAVLGRYWF